MQIDFHHGVTYVLARLAGFARPDAEIIAYAAQYVDDATNHGVIRFTEGQLYRRFTTAYRMFDALNKEALENHLVWVPFHFLPGNGGLPAGQNPGGSFVEKLTCKPGSYVARDMVEACIEDRDKPYALHRLGITAHVFADTWAHQEFAGIWHAVNDIEQLWDSNDQQDQDFWDRVSQAVKGVAYSAIPPLGHGPALDYPDRPYLAWSYQDKTGRTMVRDNGDLFTEAADELYQMFQRYRKGDAKAAVTPLQTRMREQLRAMFKGISEDDAKRRHQRWLEAIAHDNFGFGAETLTYIPKGQGSWKYQALGTTNWVDMDSDRFDFSQAFMDSHWKRFHDAAKAHRRAVIDDILPRYGICAA